MWVIQSSSAGATEQITVQVVRERPEAARPVDGRRVFEIAEQGPAQRTGKLTYTSLSKPNTLIVDLIGKPDSADGIRACIISEPMFSGSVPEFEGKYANSQETVGAFALSANWENLKGDGTCKLSLK